MDKKSNCFVNKTGATVYVIWVLFMSLFVGCQVLPDVLNNSNYVDIATRQAVGRYIDRGETVEAQKERAQNVVKTVDKVLDFLSGYPHAKPADLIDVLYKNIDTEKLNTADKFLIDDLLNFIKNYLASKQNAGLLDDDEIIRIREMLNTIKLKASLV